MQKRKNNKSDEEYDKSKTRKGKIKWGKNESTKNMKILVKKRKKMISKKKIKGEVFLKLRDEEKKVSTDKAKEKMK